MIVNTIFIVVVFFSVLELFCSKKNLVIFLIPLVTMAIFVGIRSVGGTDYDVYKLYFESIPDAIYSYGLGYFGLNYVVKFFYNDFNLLIAVSGMCAALMQGWYFYKNSNKPTLCLMMFYAVSFIWLDMVLIRQSIAAGLLLIAADFFFRRKNLLALIFLIFATMFHEVTVVIAIAGVVLYKTNSKYYAKILLASVISLWWLKIIVLYLNQNILHNGNIDAYLNEPPFISGSLLIDFLFACFIYLLSAKQRELIHAKENKIYQVIIILGIGILLISYLLPVMARLSEYIKFFYILMTVSYISRQDKITNKVLLFVALFIYCAVRLNVFLTQFDGGFIYSSYMA
ncbi:EpsG family protein [Citrobacter braakii]|uniref:EpsG family protein n=1 Tax=Citrobacter braakii TaxID=57706 RepID=UPI003975FFF4